MLQREVRTPAPQSPARSRPERLTTTAPDSPVAPPERVWATAAEPDERGTRGDALGTLLARAVRDREAARTAPSEAPWPRHRTLARLLVVDGTAQAAAAITKDAVNAVLTDELPTSQEVRAVVKRLRAWAGADVNSGDAGTIASYANWTSLGAAARAVLEGEARILSATDTEAGVDLLNRVTRRGPGPVVKALLDAFGEEVPHSEGAFSEGAGEVTPTAQERALSFGLFFEPALVQAHAAPYSLTAEERADRVSLRDKINVEKMILAQMTEVASTSSCHESAHQLQQLLGGNELQRVSLDGRAADDAATCAKELGAAIEKLAGVIATNAGSKLCSLVNVKYASHSFVIVTTPGLVEVLQSFAGPGGYPLGTGLSRGVSFEPDPFARLLVAALVPSEVPAEHADAAAERLLFGGSVFDHQHQWPAVELTFSVWALRELADITAAARERITSNLAAYRSTRAATTDAPASPTREHPSRESLKGIRKSTKVRDANKERTAKTPTRRPTNTKTVKGKRKRRTPKPK
jgi:hypothetical protein